MTTPNTEQRNDAVRDKIRPSSEIPAAIELWFFRDLGDTQRRQLINWCGIPGVSANGEDFQRECLSAILSALSQPPAPSPLEGEVRAGGDVADVREFADKVMDAAHDCCIDPDGGPDVLTSVSFTGEEGSNVAQAMHRLAARAALSTEAGSGEVRAWEYESPDGKERLVRCRRATAGEFPYCTERALTYAVAVAEAGKPASAVNEADVRHLAFILEEWDMKPRPNTWTGPAYEDIARDALARLAISSQPSDNQKMREVLAAIKVEAAAATSSDGKERDPWAIGRVLKMASAALAQSVEGGEG